VGGARTVPDLPGIVTRVDFLPDSSALVVLAGPHVRVFPLDTRLLEVEPARVLARAQDMAGLVLEGSELRAAARAHPPAE
jgi:hypothetical protein